MDTAVQDKEEVEDHLVYVRTFVADMNNMGRPQCFRTDNGGELSSRDYVEFSDSARICLEYTAPGRPQPNADFESAIWRDIEGGHAACREIRLMFPGVDLGRSPTLRANGNRLWLKGVIWVANCFTISATKTNTGWRSPYEGFLSRQPALQVALFFQEGIMRVNPSTNSDVRSELCFFFNNGHNHPSSSVNVIKASTGDLCFTIDVVWTVPRAPVLPLPEQAIAGGSVYAPALATTRFNIS